MKLIALEACFLRHERLTVPKDQFVDGIRSPSGFRDKLHHVERMAEAHGVSFLCPKSFAQNNGPIGTHNVLIWFSGSPVPPEIGRNKDGQTVRWDSSGTSLDDLTLRPSILEQAGPCCWHGFVTNGDAT
jgi:hypothetical protein